MRRNLVTTAVLLCLALPAFAQEKVSLQLKYVPGTYVTTTKMSSEQQITGPQQMNQTMTMTMVREMVVDKPTANGQQLHILYRRIQQSVKGGPMEMSYDSADKAEKGDEKNPLAVMGGLVNAPIDVTLDAGGKVAKVKGINEIWDKMAQDSPAVAGQLKKSMGEKMLTEEISQSARQLPSKPVAPGDSWEVSQKQDLPTGGTMDLKMTCTLKKIEEAGGHKVAVIEMTGGTAKPKPDDTEKKPDGDAPAKTMTMDLQQTGTMKINVATGQTEESDIVQDTTMNMVVGDMKMNVKGKSKINTTVKEGKYQQPKEGDKEKF
jgi:hypothetical protein